MWIDDDDEMDMAAAMAGEPSLGGGDDDGINFDENDMMAAIESVQADGGGSSPNPAKTLGGNRKIGVTSAAQDIGVDVTAVLGVSEMKVSNLLKIGRGAVIELNKGVGDTVDLRVAGQSVACGDVVVVEDKLAVSITETYKKNVST